MEDVLEQTVSQPTSARQIETRLDAARRASQGTGF